MDGKRERERRKMYKKILILIDDQPSSLSGVRQGVKLAAAMRSNVQFLYLLPAYSFPVVGIHADALSAYEGTSSQLFERQSREAATATLKWAVEIATTFGVQGKRSTAMGGVTAVDIVETAIAKRCGLIVVASTGKNAVMRLISGSIIPSLITVSKIPVLVCPQDDASHLGAIASEVSPRRRRAAVALQ
jgi:nucleotide-binding universal stress UspA family protein